MSWTPTVLVIWVGTERPHGHHGAGGTFDRNPIGPIGTPRCVRPRRRRDITGSLPASEAALDQAALHEKFPDQSRGSIVEVLAVVTVSAAGVIAMT